MSIILVCFDMRRYSQWLLFITFRSGSKTAAQGGADAKSRTNLPQPSLLRKTMCQAVTSPPRTCSSLFSRHCILCPSDHGSRFTRYLLAILCSRQEVQEARNTSTVTPASRLLLHRLHKRSTRLSNRVYQLQQAQSLVPGVRPLTASRLCTRPPACMTRTVERAATLLMII